MRRSWVFVLLDVLCVLVASLPFAVLTLVNTPYKRGFYCGDESIRYPYRPDTITHGLMAGVIITATVVLVSAGEAYLVYTDRLYSRSEFNNYVAAVYKVLGTFLFGAAVSQSLTDLAKYMIGRLRPNFLSVCDPDWSQVNCSVYVQVEEVCRGSPANVTEASRLARAVDSDLVQSPRAVTSFQSTTEGCLSTQDTPPSACTAWPSWRCTYRHGSAGSGHGCCGPRFSSSWWPLRSTWATPECPTTSTTGVTFSSASCRGRWLLVLLSATSQTSSSPGLRGPARKRGRSGSPACP